MGIMGTGPAAGVAQTALQAQQAARERDAQHNVRAQQARQLRESFRARLKALDEDDTGPDATDLEVDGQLAQHDPEPAEQASAYEPPVPHKQHRPDADPPPASDHTQGTHLDVEA